MCQILHTFAGIDNSTANTATQQDNGFDPTGWELALVATPSSNTNPLAMQSNLVGFLNLSLRISTFLWLPQFPKSRFGNCYAATHWFLASLSNSYTSIVMLHSVAV